MKIVPSFLIEYLYFVDGGPIDKIIVGLDNRLVLSGNKPLPELMLSETFVAGWSHQVTMSFTH